eukprot:COSAG06_NODE_2094_length_7584_cov_3.135437_2_plen_165_part_00
MRHGALAGAVSGATVLRCCLLLLRRAPYVTGACSARQRPQAALRYQTRAGKGWNLLWVYARHSDASFDDTPSEPAFSHNATPSLLAISPLAPLPSLAAQVHFTSTILWPIISHSPLSASLVPVHAEAEAVVHATVPGAATILVAASNQCSSFTAGAAERQLEID